jgi:hypothetical protein
MTWELGNHEWSKHAKRVHNAIRVAARPAPFSTPEVIVQVNVGFEASPDHSV